MSSIFSGQIQFDIDLKILCEFESQLKPEMFLRPAPWFLRWLLVALAKTLSVLEVI
jgi:hypothetical protein